MDQDSLFKMMLARTMYMEEGYKKLEDGYEMTDEQLKEMNEGLHLEKDKNYRPYCLKDGCDTMPRMALKEFGFQCPSCYNKINFSLIRI